MNNGHIQLQKNSFFFIKTDVSSEFDATYLMLDSM